MKSKTYFSKCLTDSAKKRLWAFGCMLLILAIILPIRTLMRLDELAIYEPASREHMQEVYTVIVLSTSTSGLISRSFTLWLIPFMGAILGILDFAFLHSKSQIDFQFSLPTKRRELFFARALTTYLWFVLAYTIMLGVTLLLGNARDLLDTNVLITVLISWLVTQITFWLSYLAGSLAMILTGRIVVGLLGTAVFLGFGAVLQALLGGFAGLFFKTYAPAYGFDNIMSYFSPAGYSQRLMERLIDAYMGIQSLDVMFWVVVAVGIVVVVGLLLLGAELMHIRQAEAAGRSMAFPKTARVIHVILSIVAGLYIGMTAARFAYSRVTVWAIVGTLCGTILVYLLIQFIYTLDFRKSCQYGWQILVAEVVAVALTCLFCFDLLGYDQYQPAQDQIESVGISPQIYYNWSEDVYENGTYLSEDTYRLNHMHLQETPELQQLITDFIEDQKEVNYNTHQVGGVATSAVTVRYHLKNGMTVNRSYQVELAKYKNEFAALFGQSEFRELIFPVLQAKTVQDVTLQYTGEYTTLFSQQEDRLKEFMNIYLGEMRNLPGNVFVEENPIASLLIQYGEDGSDSNRVMIYPSCTKAIDYLKEQGIEVKSILDPANIKQIEVYDYRSENTVELIADNGANASTSTSTNRSVETFTNPEDIAKMVPALLESEYASFWRVISPNLYATVTMDGPKGYEIVVSCDFSMDQIPELLQN